MSSVVVVRSNASDLPTPPAGGGFLPYWLLITSAASIYNVAQNYVTLKQSKEVYSGKPDQSESRRGEARCAASSPSPRL